jgi:hypothetical protein
MFNCPKFKIGVESITSMQGEDFESLEVLAIKQLAAPTSCDSLVTVCIDVTIPAESPFIGIEFIAPTFVHIGEVTFFNDPQNNCSTAMSTPATDTLRGKVYCSLTIIIGGVVSLCTNPQEMYSSSLSVPLPSPTLLHLLFPFPSSPPSP